MARPGVTDHDIFNATQHASLEQEKAQLYGQLKQLESYVS